MKIILHGNFEMFVEMINRNMMAVSQASQTKSPDNSHLTASSKTYDMITTKNEINKTHKKMTVHVSTSALPININIILSYYYFILSLISSSFTPYHDQSQTAKLLK